MPSFKSCIKASVDDAGSDCQASSSNDYIDCAIIEDPQSGSDSDGEDVSLSPPKPKMAKKLLGAATYKTKFNLNWTKEYSFITSVPSDPYRLIICYRQL